MNSELNIAPNNSQGVAVEQWLAHLLAGLPSCQGTEVEQWLACLLAGLPSGTGLILSCGGFVHLTWTPKPPKPKLGAKESSRESEDRHNHHRPGADLSVK